MSNPLLEKHELPPFSLITPEHAEAAVRQLIERNKAAIDALLEEHAGEIAAVDPDGRALIDLTGFLVRDAHRFFSRTGDRLQVLGTHHRAQSGSSGHTAQVIGDTGEAHHPLPGEPDPLWIAGEVVRDDQGLLFTDIGIRFLAMANAHWRALRRWVRVRELVLQTRPLGAYHAA